MKKIAWMVVALLACGMVPTQAQTTFKRNEISVSYGGPTLTNIANLYADMIGSIFIGHLEGADFSGAMNVDYLYRVNKTIGVGAAFSYEHAKSDLFLDQTTGKGASVSNYISVMPAVKFNWINKPLFTLYSKAAVGVQFEFCKQSFDAQSETQTSTYFAFQASLLGMEVGRRVCAFTEIGFGQQGVVQIGVKYKF